MRAEVTMFPMLKTLKGKPYNIFEFTAGFHASCFGWPTFENMCLYFKSKSQPIRLSIAILERHRFIELVDGRYQIHARKPLLMPFKGIVK